MTNNAQEQSAFERLAVGDEVYVYGEYGAIGTIARIERITPTQIIVHGNRYRRRTGDEVGADTWRGGAIGIVTDEHRASVRRKRAIDALRRLTSIADARVRVSTENIEAAVKLLTPSEG